MNVATINCQFLMLQLREIGEIADIFGEILTRTDHFTIGIREVERDVSVVF